MNVGFGSLVAAADIRMIIQPYTPQNRNYSAPLARLRKEADAAGRLANLTQGRKVRAIIILDSNQVILSAVGPETLWSRLEEERRANGEGGRHRREANFIYKGGGDDQS